MTDARRAEEVSRRVLRDALESHACVALWIILSAVVILFNKYILSVYGFPYPIALTMTHMAFCSAIAFALVRVFKVVEPSEGMTRETYRDRVAPIALLFAISLWASNTAYVYLSVAYIQMLKALSPVTVYGIGCAIGLEKFTARRLGNLGVVTLGVMIASYGELNFNMFGFCVQLLAVVVEACRIVSVQIVLGKANLKLNPITTLYYVSPASFVFLLVPFALLEMPKIVYGYEVTHSVHYQAGIMLGNASCAFLLNLALYLLIGRTSALTLNVSGVIKDMFLIGISAAVFESPISATQLVGSLVAFSGVCYYNYAKLNEAQRKAAQELETQTEVKTGDNKLEKL